MRKAIVGFILSWVAVPAGAQRLWSPEIGIQGGFARVKPAGTHRDDAFSFVDVPGGSFVTAALSYAPLYAIIPVGDRFAVEPQVAATQATAGQSFTVAKIGARVDYAVTRALYVAGGGFVNYIQSNTPNHSDLGLQLGVGYRMPLGGGLNSRIEAGWLSRRRSGAIQPVNAYTVLVGVSSRLDAAPPPARSPRPPHGSWTTTVGINSGYTSAHAVGQGTVTLLLFPGSGVDPNSLGVLIPTTPTLFAQLPLGGRWAFEPSLDVEYSKAPATLATTTKVGIGSRLDYAVHGGWYAAAGAQLTYFQFTGLKSGGVPGFLGAWGYRFHLAREFGGRVEVNYLMSARHTALSVPPINTLGLLFGATMRLQ